MRLLTTVCVAALLATCATATLSTKAKAPSATPAPKATKADVEANLEDAADGLKAAIDKLAHIKDPRPVTYDFAYGGSGALLIFQLGVSAALAEHRVYTSETRWASISGGSVVSALSATGAGAAAAVSRLLQTIIDALPPTLEGGEADAPGMMMAAAGAPGLAAADEAGLIEAGEAGLVEVSPPNLAALLTAALLELMPSNAADLANENSRLHVWASQLNPNATTIQPPSPRAHDLYPYTSRLDLAQAVTASSYVPCQIGTKNADYFRGGAWIDAGASTSLDFLCASMQPSTAKCTPVVAVVVGPGSPDQTFDGCTPPLLNPANTGPLYPPVPPEEWALNTNCSAYNSTSDFGVVREALTPDTICPGCRTQIPYTQCEWKEFIAFKFDGPTAVKIFDIGLAEGTAWAEERGFKRVGQ